MQSVEAKIHFLIPPSSVQSAAITSYVTCCYRHKVLIVALILSESFSKKQKLTFTLHY